MSVVNVVGAVHRLLIRAEVARAVDREVAVAPTRNLAAVPTRQDPAVVPSEL